MVFTSRWLSLLTPLPEGAATDDDDDDDDDANDDDDLGPHCGGKGSRRF